jgi:hypothetical protein
MPQASRIPLLMLVTVAALLVAITPYEECRAYPAATFAQKKGSPKLTDDQKKAIAAAAKQTLETLKIQEAQMLTSAYILLAAANGDYEGHRQKAMNHVATALNKAAKDGVKQSQPNVKALQNLNTLAAAQLFPGQGNKAPESQVISDAQVANAGATLTTFVKLLANTDTSHPDLAKHVKEMLPPVQNAITAVAAAQQSIASQALKGKEADILTSAYVLLAAANHDYNGHRAKAMKEVEHACNKLEASIAKNGTVDQKIKAIKDANAEALAKNRAASDATLHEPQVASDSQLVMADALIQRVAAYMSANKQSRGLSHMTTAHQEIGIALSIR